MGSPIILKPGKDKAVRQGHPWIFSGAIASGLGQAEGDIRQVYSFEHKLLGSGYFNARSSICGRMLSLDNQEPLQAVREHILNAIALRHRLVASELTNGYRLVNGEGDFLPGLIVDRYGDVLVLQISTKGMARLREMVVDILVDALHPQAIYDKSTMPVRQEEGLEPSEEWLLGTPQATVPFRENGLHFLAALLEGQKTGFFLDQRPMRQLVRSLSNGRKVLNCFSYSGAFTIAALAGGAVGTASVDVSAKALDLAREHVLINGFDVAQQQFFHRDVFEFLRQEDLSYDLVILDPPAFSKKRHDVVQACRGYKDINRLAIKKMPKNSLLLTSSCSHFVDDLLFQKVVFQAATEAGRSVRILDRHHYSPDHPENICHPEGHYLKSLLLYIS